MTLPPPSVSFCLNNFWTTTARLNAEMLAYNLMGLFRQAALKHSAARTKTKDIQHTRKTQCYELFAKASNITHKGRKDILKLAVVMHQRECLSGIWDHYVRTALTEIGTQEIFSELHFFNFSASPKGATVQPTNKAKLF
jgi:hypothetical protein